MSTSRERILTRLRASLERNRAEMQAEAARASHTPPFVHPRQDDLAAQFAAELVRLEGLPHRCADDAAALAAVRGVLQTHQATSVIAWDFEQIGLPGLDALLAEAGVTLLDSRVVYT